MCLKIILYTILFKITVINRALLSFTYTKTIKPDHYQNIIQMKFDQDDFLVKHVYNVKNDWHFRQCKCQQSCTLSCLSVPKWDSTDRHEIYYKYK